MKRGRKQNNDLPPSRSRDIQRAFRARRAQYIANLERRVADLESENVALRNRLLGLGIDVPPLPQLERPSEATTADGPGGPGATSGQRASADDFRQPGPSSHAVPPAPSAQSMHHSNHGWQHFAPNSGVSTLSRSLEDVKPDLSTLSEVAAGKRKAPSDWPDMDGAPSPSSLLDYPPQQFSSSPSQLPLPTPRPPASVHHVGLPGFSSASFPSHPSFPHPYVVGPPTYGDQQPSRNVSQQSRSSSSGSQHLFYSPAGSQASGSQLPPHAPSYESSQQQQLQHRHSNPAIHTFGWNTASPPASGSRYDSSTAMPPSSTASPYPSAAVTPASSPPSSSGAHLGPVWMSQGGSGASARGRPSFTAVGSRVEGPSDGSHQQPGASQHAPHSTHSPSYPPYPHETHPR